MALVRLDDRHDRRIAAVEHETDPAPDRGYGRQIDALVCELYGLTEEEIWKR